MVCVICHQNHNFQDMVRQEVVHDHPSGPIKTSETETEPQALWDQYGRHDFMHDMKYFVFVLFNTQSN